MGDGPWTIERIAEALGAPVLRQRFFAEINRAEAHELLQVFAKWERIAKDQTAAVERGRRMTEYDERGEEPPGEWVDATDRVQDEATRIREHGAA